MRIKDKKKLLVFADHFQPAYKAGGPIQSLTNLLGAIKDRVNVFILTKNHDLHEPHLPFDGVLVNEWRYSEEYGINTYYRSPASSAYASARQALQAIQPDFIYLNSFFSPKATLWPLLAIMRENSRAQVVLAARGELARSALAIKPWKKRVYIRIFRCFMAGKITIWHATSTAEAANIRCHFPAAKISIAGNLPTQVTDADPTNEKPVVDFILVSRVAKVKNIDFFFKALRLVKRTCSIEVYGVVEDKEYWVECLEILADLPDHVSVNYQGEILPPQVIPTIKMARFFVSPTSGENFGHSIFEAFVAARPVLISTQTPWVDLLQKGIGWDLPINDPIDWVEVIEQCLDLNEQTYAAMCAAARRFADEYRFNPARVEAYRGVLF